MKTKKLAKNLFIFSDGSFFLTSHYFYNNNNFLWFNKDLKKSQKDLKKKTLISISNLNNTTTYRKKLFK